MAIEPSAALGQMMSGTCTRGACQASAKRDSSPPLVTTTIFAPARAASDAASIVSSVPPEHETAKTRVVSSTKCGHSYPFTTVTGTGKRGDATA